MNDAKINIKEDFIRRYIIMSWKLIKCYICYKIVLISNLDKHSKLIYFLKVFKS